MDSNKTGSLLRRLRLERGLTQRQVAERLHLSDRTDQCLSALPGRGDFDFRGFFRYLREGGCTASGVIELYRGDFGSEEELQDALDYLKEQTI